MIILPRTYATVPFFTQFMVVFIGIAKLFHNFVYEPWSKSSLLQSQAKTATSCK